MEEPTHGRRMPKLKCQLGCRQQTPGPVRTKRCQRGGKLQSAERCRGRTTVLCPGGGDLEVGRGALVFTEHRLGAVPRPAVRVREYFGQSEGGAPSLARGRRLLQR